MTSKTTITAAARPYLLTFVATGTTYAVSSDEAQRLLDEYPAVTARPNKVVLQGHNSSRASDRTVLQPATRGGGPAFMIDRGPAHTCGTPRTDVRWCPACGGMR